MQKYTVETIESLVEALRGIKEGQKVMFQFYNKEGTEQSKFGGAVKRVVIGRGLHHIEVKFAGGALLCLIGGSGVFRTLHKKIVIEID